MKDNELEKALQNDAELDNMLTQMAEEVPPMPADFHDRWMNAVRADAEATAPEKKESVSGNHPVSIVRWTRFFSVAAVFVFLIGGTLLYRNSRKSLSVLPYKTDRQESAESAAEPAGGTLFTDNEPEIPADMEENSTAEPAVINAYLQAAGEKAEDFDDEDTAGISSGKRADSGQTIFTAAATVVSAPADEAEQEGAAEMNDASEASEYAAGLTVESAAEMPVPTSRPTATPTAMKVPAPTASSLPPEPAEEEEKSAAETGIPQAVGVFFTDMGDFLLAALPYLLVLAVPAVTALIIRRKNARKS